MTQAQFNIEVYSCISFPYHYQCLAALNALYTLNDIDVYASLHVTRFFRRLPHYYDPCMLSALMLFHVELIVLLSVFV